MTIDAPKIMFYTQDSWQQAAVRDPIFKVDRKTRCEKCESSEGS